MSDLKIKAAVVADTSKIKSNIEMIKPTIRVQVDTSALRGQVEKALADIQLPQGIISASSAEALSRSSPDIQSRVNYSPELPAVEDNSSKGVFDTVSDVLGTVVGLIGTYNTLKPVVGGIKKNLG